MNSTNTTKQSDEISPFWRWEQLRLPYNLVLIALMVAYLTLVNPSRLSDTTFLISMTQIGLMFNVAFILGSIIESVFNSVGMGSLWLTTTLFMAGLILSSFSLLILLFSFEFRNAML